VAFIKSVAAGVTIMRQGDDVILLGTLPKGTFAPSNLNR
jgi:hypothetical protein